jgi:Carboxypeptidase regulatory-like domain
MKTGRWQGLAAWLLALAILGVPSREANALITGGVGNKPLTDPGWPKGAASLFNNPGRIAWWEGPPFGGGQWHAECRGNAKALSAALSEFAKIEAKTRRVVVHDGVGQSFWLNPNGEADKVADARMDWMFMVWQGANWEHLRKLPAGLNPTDPRDAETGPPSQIDVFAGGSVRWADVTVPAGLEVVDQRLEAHGFTSADGLVLEGKVTDLVTKAPILAARTRLQRVEPQKTGGYLYPSQAEAVADASGRWTLTKTPSGWYRVVVEADGYAPRVAGYARPDGQPCWSSHDCGLARASSLAGRIIDEAGRPLADVAVRLDDVTAEGVGGLYQSPDEYRFKTDADGRFRSGPIPAGRANVWIHKPGYCRPGLGLPVTIPDDKVELVMKRSSGLRITVDFGGKARPSGYMVKLVPEGGEAVGKYGASGDIDAANKLVLEDIPPGRYVLTGRANPSSGDDQTAPVTIELKGGETAEVTLTAK